MASTEIIRVRSPLRESSTPSTPSRRTAADANSLSDLQEGMFRPGNLLRDHGAQGINLFVGNRNRFPAHADDPEHSVGAIHSHALVVVAGHQLDEDVATEQRQLYFFLAIAPAPDFGDQGQKSGQALFLKPFRNHFLVARPGLHRVPVRRFLLGHQLRVPQIARFD